MVKVEHVLMTRHLIIPLAMILLVIQSGAVKAQGVFPAPLPRSGRRTGQRSRISAGQRHRPGRFIWRRPSIVSGKRCGGS